MEVEFIGINDNQQHPDFFLVEVSLWRVVPGLPGLFAARLVGLPCTFDLISLERVVKAFSTFTASLAEVSKNLMPNDSAKLFPSSALT